MMSQDVVGFWDIPLSNGIHRVEFQHGTTTGKRVITVNGKVTTKRCGVHVTVVADINSIELIKMV